MWWIDDVGKDREFKNQVSDILKNNAYTTQKGKKDEWVAQSAFFANITLH